MHNTILITGATSGIGEATLRVFAEEGWSVIATYHTAVQKAEDISQEYGDNVVFFELDLTDDKSIRHAVDKIQNDYSS